MSVQSRLPDRKKLFSTPREARFSWYNVIDPMYWVAFFLSSPIFKYQLQTNEINFIHDNINKHRIVLWANLIAAIVLFRSLTGLSIAELNSLISALLAPALVTGGAWFAITFGGVPQRLLPLAINITLWMFAAFTVSLTTMFLSLYFILPIPIFLVFGFIVVAIVISAARYDNVDGLKAGLDEALRMHSLTHVKHLQEKHGAEIIEEESKLNRRKQND
jgi:hypothetical protein